MPDSNEKKKQEKPRNIVSADSMKGALNKALSTVSSPMLPERPGLTSNSIFKKDLGFDVPMFGGVARVGIPSMADMYDNIRDYTSPIGLAAMGMMGMNRPRVPQSSPAMAGQGVSAAELPPDMVAVGSEAAYNKPRMPVNTGPSDQALYNIARRKFGMGMDMPTPAPPAPPFWTNYRGQ